jgi:hypothetical protein
VALTFFLVSFEDRAPFHAAALRRGATALLLAGPSGMGKSTLAYAASRRGAGLFAEDYVWVQQRPRFRLWGRPRGFHLPVEAARFFPELAGRAPAILANGKAKIAVPVPRPGRAEAAWVDRAAVCVLGRARGAPRLSRLTARATARLLAAEMTAGFDIFADVVGPLVRHCCRHGGWKLWLSRDPREAVPLVQRLLEEVAEARA